MRSPSGRDRKRPSASASFSARWSTHGTTKVGLPDGPPFFRFSDADESRGALSRAGFTAVAVRTLPLVWQLPSGEALFEAALHGGVRTSAALQAQTPEALAAIRRAVLS